MTDAIRVEQRAGWRKLVLNRPDKLNALTEEMMTALIAALDAVGAACAVSTPGAAPAAVAAGCVCRGVTRALLLAT